MRTRLHPFSKLLQDIVPADLVCLRDVAEGWYVEYKSTLLPARSLAKSLSAFANQYGGYLVLGVGQSSDGRNVAASFPGVDSSDIPRLEAALRDASKNSVSPHIYFQHRILNGPEPQLSLPAGRAIVVVYVPQGPDGPYVHNDGKIYRRVGDASEPRPETDRTALDLLWQRGQRARTRLATFVEPNFRVGDEEDDTPFVHLFISHDPLEAGDRRPKVQFEDFVLAMKAPDIIFENCFSRANGHVARHVGSNAVLSRLLTWEYDHSGHSMVSSPLSWHDGDQDGARRHFGAHYEHAARFLERLEAEEAEGARVVDLNQLFAMLLVAVRKHRRLVGRHGISGPFFTKCSVRGMWRVVPFLDTQAYVEFIRDHGIPVVQESSALLPVSHDLATFIELEERAPAPAEGEELIREARDAAQLAMPLFMAFGIPPKVMVNSSNELLTLHERSQRTRGSVR